VFPRVQQRHIQHHDGDASFFGDDAPLLLNLRVAASKPVKALDYQRVARVQAAQKPTITGCAKMPSFRGSPRSRCRGGLIRFTFPYTSGRWGSF